MAVSERPWGRYAEAEYSSSEWRSACLVDTGIGDPDAKSRYKLPVREPMGEVNRGAVQAAAGGLAAVRGISSDMRSSVGRQLVALLRDVGEEPPEGLMTMAGLRDARDTPAVDTATPLYRSFAPDLEVKHGGDGRTVYGIAVPYNAPTRIDGELVEQFARGAFNHQVRDPGRVKFAREHVMLGGSLIGALSAMRDDAAGLYVEMRASRTPVGDETLERVKAHLAEVAVVMEGAYGDLATAAGVRSAQVPAAALDLDLRAAAETYLVGGLPEPTDNELVIRAIELGLF